MTVDEALKLVAIKASGRTRYENQELYLDEILANEIHRCRNEIATLLLTLSMNTKPVENIEPIGCPIPGACATVRLLEVVQKESSHD